MTLTAWLLLSLPRPREPPKPVCGFGSARRSEVGGAHQSIPPWRQAAGNELKRLRREFGQCDCGKIRRPVCHFAPREWSGGKMTGISGRAGRAIAPAPQALRRPQGTGHRGAVHQAAEMRSAALNLETWWLSGCARNWPSADEALVIQSNQITGWTVLRSTLGKSQRPAGDGRGAAPHRG